MNNIYVLTGRNCSAFDRFQRARCEVMNNCGPVCRFFFSSFNNALLNAFASVCTSRRTLWLIAVSGRVGDGMNWLTTNYRTIKKKSEFFNCVTCNTLMVERGRDQRVWSGPQEPHCLCIVGAWMMFAHRRLSEFVQLLGTAMAIGRNTDKIVNGKSEHEFQSFKWLRLFGHASFISTRTVDENWNAASEIPLSGWVRIVVDSDRSNIICGM